MAMSGTVSSSGYESRRIDLEWTATHDKANNRSLVKWTLKGAGGNSSYYYMAGGFKVTINGTVVYSKSTDYRIQLKIGTVVASGETYVSHNTGGTKTFSIAIEAGIYYYAVNCTGSKSFTLDPITFTVTSTFHKYKFNTTWNHFATETTTVGYGNKFTPYNTTVPAGYYAGNNFGYYNNDTGAQIGNGTVGTDSITITCNTRVHVHYYPNKYNVDLNGKLDGTTVYAASPMGTADIYINGSLVENDVGDYNTAHYTESTYEIKDIKTNPGYTYTGAASYTGTIGTANVGVYPTWTTNSYTLTVKPNWGSWNGSTSNQTASQKYNTSKSLAVPTKKGHSFIAWAEQGAGTISNALRSNGSFDGGSNGVYVYNNSGNGVVSHAIQSASSGNPIGSGYELKISHSGGTSSPGLGGFFDSNTASASKKWVHAFIAKIPVGYTLNIAHNAIGTGSSEYWLTERVGTGEWKEYSYVIQCGSSGSFSTFGHVYLTGPSGAFSWYLAYSNMYDITSGVGAVNYNYLAGNGSVYAMYYPNDYTLTINPNGGSWNGSTSTQTFTQKYNTTKVLSEKPTRSGYKFLYWAATSSPTTANFGMNVNTGNAEIPRYRIAKASSTNLEILLYAPNAVTAKCPTWTNTGGQDDLIWHVMNSGSWTRDGYMYNFGLQISIADHNYELLDYITHLYVYNSSGTALTSIGSINLFDIQLGVGDTYYFHTNNYTLYAIWELDTCTISYNGNGNIVSNVPSTQTKTIGTNLTLSSTSPARGDRYKFLGWAESSSATSAAYQPGATFTKDVDTTLYAVWQLLDKDIYLYNTGKIDAVDFKTVSSVNELFDNNGYVYATQFVTHSESNIYIGKDGKIYAKEFIKY